MRLNSTIYRFSVLNCKTNGTSVFVSGGDSKTLMFLQISPNENDLSETLCSLNFASRVRGIELGPAKRQMDTSEVLRYKQMVNYLCSCSNCRFIVLVV